MKKAAWGIILAFMFVIVQQGFSLADEKTLEDRLKALEGRIEALENKIIQQDQQIKEQDSYISTQKQIISGYEERFTKFDQDLHREKGLPEVIAEGLEIGAGGTLIVQGTNNANAGLTKKEGRTDGSYSADVTIGKDFKEVGGRAFLHLEGGQGDGLEDNLIVYSNVNRDTDNEDRVHITELWYEQLMFKDRIALTFGKLDPTVYFDNSEVANDETTQFLGRIFRNNPVVEFPDNTLGIRAALIPYEWLEFNLGAFDSNNDWEKIADNLFNIGQVNFKTKFFGLDGNYRFLGWNSNAYHTKWLEPVKNKESAYGFALSFDQKFNDFITVFARYGWQDPKVYNPDLTASDDSLYSLEQSWSTGLQIAGKPWGRQDDVLAFAVGQAIPSKDYKNSLPGLRAKNEGHFEAYYRIQVNKHLAISPDFQYIWNPFGKDVAGDTAGIFIGGMRTQIDF